MRFGKILEGLRDRVIHRSQIGKRKLDSAFTRRELDRSWVRLGEKYSDLARRGRAVVPEELTALVEEVRRLERKLSEQEEDVTNLQREVAGER